MDSYVALPHAEVSEIVYDTEDQLVQKYTGKPLLPPDCVAYLKGVALDYVDSGLKPLCF